MNGYGNVAKHSFGTSCRDNDFADFVVHRISDVPQSPLFVFVIYFNISIAGLVFGAVINDALTSVNQTFFPHFFECAIYGCDDFLIQSKD